MELRSYYDFALDDYNFLQDLRRSGITANSIGAIAQNTCERFLKHLINEYIPVTYSNRQEVTDILTTHNLNRLVNFWNHFSENAIPAKVANELRKINGFYFSTKYPGDDSLTLTRANIETCFTVVDLCKDTVDWIINEEDMKRL